MSNETSPLNTPGELDGEVPLDEATLDHDRADLPVQQHFTSQQLTEMGYPPQVGHHGSEAADDAGIPDTRIADSNYRRPDQQQ
jgi:hypothetical protein